VHADEPDVEKILGGNMTSLSQRRAFAKLRNRGILQVNKERVANDDQHFERIKTGQSSEIVHCNICQGSYSRQFFYRHKKHCHQDEETRNNAIPRKIPVALLGVNEDEDFLNILSSFQDNAIGHTCRTDDTIRLIGRHLWRKDRTKVDKHDEVRKSVMADMRNLAALFIEFQKHEEGRHSANAKVMFNREKWSILEEAVICLTTSATPQSPDAHLKYGLKNTLYYLLMKSADILQGDALTVKGDQGKKEVEELQHFVTILKHHQNAVFGDAKYMINKSRQERLRLPARTPPDELMMKLRTYTVQRINELTGMQRNTGRLGRSAFVELRNLVCCRLTLFNARRGGEPSRMKTTQWRDRHQWITNKSINQLDDTERNMFRELELVYTTGKGNHLVSCMVPRDCVPAVELLTHATIRKDAGVLDTNDFIFPSIGSTLHCGGWDAMHKVCEAAQIESNLINATNQRGRLSTIYAGLDVAPEDRSHFYSHMGHSEKVNVGTYQRPLAVMAITKVGKHLMELDVCAGKEGKGG